MGKLSWPVDVGDGEIAQHVADGWTLELGGLAVRGAEMLRFLIFLWQPEDDEETGEVSEDEFLDVSPALGN